MHARKRSQSEQGNQIEIQKDMKSSWDMENGKSDCWIILKKVLRLYREVIGG